MKLYIYNGPVLYFGKCVADHWFGSTYAPTKRKARSNLEYRFKKENNYTVNDIRKARIDRVREGYVLRMPKVQPID